LGLVEGFLFPTLSFRQQPALRQRSRSARRDVLQLAASAGPAGESDKDDKDKGAADMSSALLASLRARQQSLKKEEEKLQKNWRKGTCVSRAGLFLDDWVRRVSLDWPLVAVGGAGGGVYVADINTGEILAEAKDAHPAYIETMEAEMEMRLLHGDYDGGGVTALAFSLSQNLLVSGGRDGKALVWQFDMDKKNLELKATLPCGNKALSAIAVSACGEMIWTGTQLTCVTGTKVQILTYC
jgi:WD40 repeat protein